MRVLVVHPGVDFSVADVHNGWVKGLQAVGCDAREFNLHDRIAFYSNAHMEKVGEPGTFIPAFEFQAATRLAAQAIKSVCLEWWPDLVVLISDFFIDNQLVDILKARGFQVAAVMTESPYEDTKQLGKLDGLDAVAINDPLHLDAYRAVLGDAAFYAPHCYDPDLHRPGPAVPEFKADTCFVGTGLPSRVKFLEAVPWDGIDLLLAGFWGDLADDSPLKPYVIHQDDQWCVPNEQTVRIYQSASTSFNVYRIENNEGVHDSADGWAMGPREVELAATGCWFSRQSRPEGDDVLSMLPTFSTPGELADQIRWALAHPDQRETAAEAARAAVADRTFDVNAVRLLKALGY